MNPAAQKWISRKELSMLTGLSVDSLRRSERHLGLDRIKVNPNPRCVLYYRAAAISVMEIYITETHIPATEVKIAATAHSASIA